MTNDLCYVHGYENYDGSREYVVCDGPYQGNVYGWVETSVALDGSCQRENYCCFEGSREACFTYIDSQFASKEYK